MISQQETSTGTSTKMTIFSELTLSGRNLNSWTFSTPYISPIFSLMASTKFIKFQIFVTCHCPLLNPRHLKIGKYSEGIPIMMDVFGSLRSDQSCRVPHLFLDLWQIKKEILGICASFLSKSSCSAMRDHKSS